MKKLNIILAGLLAVCPAFLGAADLGKKLFGQSEQKLFTSVVEEKQKQRDALLKEQELHEQETKNFTELIDDRIGQVKNNINAVKKSLTAYPDDEFLEKKQTLFNEQYLVLNDTKRVRDQLQTLRKQHIKQLEEYIRDPDFKEFQKEHKLYDRTTYSLEDLQLLNQLLLQQKEVVASIAQQEKNSTTELENRKNTATATHDTYKKIQEQLQGQQDAPKMAFDVTPAQRKELLTLELQLYEYKKELDNFKFKEIEDKLAFIKTKAFMAKGQYALLKKMRATVKPAIRVSEADVSFARDELAKKKQESFMEREKYRQAIDAISKEIEAKQDGLQVLSKKYNISLEDDIDDWSHKPKESVASYFGLVTVATANDYMLLLHDKKGLLEAQVLLETEKMRYESVRVDSKDSYHKMLTRSFGSEDELIQEIKLYSGPKSEAKANLSLFNERKSFIADRLSIQNKALENIKNLRQVVQQNRVTLFKKNFNEYMRVLELLNNAHMGVKEQIDTLNKTTSVYNNAIDMINKSVLQVDFIVAELESITIWRSRPDYAISWQGVKSIPSDLQAFMYNINGYIKNFSIAFIVDEVKDAAAKPMTLLGFVLQVVLLLLLIVVRKFLPGIVHKLLTVRPDYHGLHKVSLFAALVFDFLAKHFVSVATWLSILLFIMMYTIPDLYLYIIFYLISIPYLLYLANRFIKLFSSFNIRHDYVFLTKDFQQRFVTVFSILLYATSVIVCFKQAFMLSGYHKSELPTILLAINFIIFQISLILLISKEQILNLIPDQGSGWNFIKEQVDNYYYLLLSIIITIIVMSNPYVGFGRLVLYIFSRLFYSGLALWGLFWVHTFFKKISSSAFFAPGDDGFKERFTYAKTWYGVFVIVLFFIFVSCGLILGAKIWGWPEGIAKITQWQDIMDWLRTPIMLEKTDSPISVVSILHIITFMLVGSVVWYSVNHFVLQRIFDVLLIDTGVQNTVSSIIRYLILMTSIFLGFQAVGLDALVTYVLGALIIGLGWVIKDPLADFVAYFILLVQRPFKIGDFIKLDNDVLGVVRKITPRSVIIRAKNSVSIVVPNSQVTTKSLVNWNYSRGFIAFNDISLCISYQHEPREVQKMFLQVLADNKYVLANPTPIVRLEEFGEYGFIFMVRGYISSNYTLDQWDIASDIRLELMDSLRSRDMYLAIPVRMILSDDKKEPTN